MMPRSKTTPAKECTAEEKTLNRQHYERWKRVGPLLDGIRFRELRAMSDEERIHTLTGIMACPFPRQADDTSGWIAWQKVREQWMKRR
jgi:hypothetical protein